MSYYKRSFNKDGQSAEDKALSRFADTMVARIKEIQTDNIAVSVPLYRTCGTVHLTRAVLAWKKLTP